MALSRSVARPRLRSQLQLVPAGCDLRSVSGSAAAAGNAQVGTWPWDAGAAFFDKNAEKRGAVSPSHVGRFYQRSLPLEQVPFASSGGRRLFQEALLDGTMENYFYLAEQFRTQDEPTFCGLSTLAMVLNSLRIDPMRTWKGVWRWFNEQNLGCCEGPEQVREAGLSFDMFRCLAVCNGADVVAHRSPAATEPADAQQAFAESFRAAVRATSRSQERECIVICYSREALGQSGAGHFSPLGGYHAGRDAVLIMDVARFKYPPHWARIDDVVEAMSCVDPDTGRPRGFLHFRLLERQGPDDGRGLAVPLHLPFMPAAAGKRLSKALVEALASGQAGASPCAQEGCEEAALPAGVGVVRRWLSAVSAAEPQVLGQLLQVGDAAALSEIFMRLEAFPPFRELCAAYSLLEAGKCGGLPGDFPPLLFSKSAVGRNGGSAMVPPPAHQDDIGLGACGELWVLLLLLLPEHLRAGASPDLAGPWVAKGIAKAVRGPWALPLEALREALGHTLVPPPQGQACRPQ